MTYQEKLRDRIRSALKVARKLDSDADKRRDIVQALTEAMKELALPEIAWGPVIEVHHIGTFTIMEYEDRFSGVEGQRYFYVQSSGHYASLDEALLGAICTKYGDSEDLDYMLRILKKERLE